MSKTWSANTGIGRVVLGAAVASDLWWIKSKTLTQDRPERTYLVVGVNVNVYPEMYVFNLHLFTIKLSLAWGRNWPK